jgi:hypothetical protein
LLDLGEQPLANSFTTEPHVLPTFPLAVNHCVDCTHVQLTECVSREEIFEEYIYVSGTTETLRQDFKNFAIEITERHGIGRILDIACNDGSQLDAFKELGWETWGIDPAKNLFETSSANHNVLCDFLNDSHLELGKFDVVIAQNVLAHTNDPLNFLNIAGQMTSNLYIQTSQADMIFKGQFDTIYHEHLSFFSQASMNELALRAGMNLKSVVRREIHGSSYLFHLVNEKTSFVPFEFVTNDVLLNFRQTAENIITSLQTMLKEQKKKNVPIIGYGAAAKGMTVLNAVGIPIDFIIDDNTLKQNTFTPGLSIPVRSIDALKEMGEVICLLPLAWNFAEEIQQRVSQNYGGEINLLRYFPKVSMS